MSKDALDDFTVIKYAQIAALKLGLKIPKHDYLLGKMNLNIPQPVFITNGKQQLWVDKLYIAISCVDIEAVKYVYLTKKHINEERRDYCRAYRSKRTTARLPRFVRIEFLKAKAFMKEKEKEYYLDSDFFKNG